MAATPQHPDERLGNADRGLLHQLSPRSQRTYTPSLAVIERSAGAHHWTRDGKRLCDFTSGVLVANLGHNPAGWLADFQRYLGWPTAATNDPFVPAAPLTAYNATTPLEIDASRRLLQTLRERPGGGRMEQVVWAASGSEAVHKALWAALNRKPGVIVATRYGFHGKKGLAFAVTGHESEAERDPRVRWASFPREECADVTHRGRPFDAGKYRAELDALPSSVSAVVTEPYLGGGGSFHPPADYLRLLQAFCRERDALFVLDEVQSNFGRTRALFAYEAYGLEPDLVVLGKGLGNGVPVAAVAGRREAFAALGYGEASDTWSGNPLSAAAVLATLDAYSDGSALANAHAVSPRIEAALVALQRLPFVAHVRGEAGGMVWGVEFRDHAAATANEWANRAVLAAYRGEGAEGVHLLGPLAGKVVRVSPPLTITAAEADAALALLDRCLAAMA